jgi:hypothetical protein
VVGRVCVWCGYMGREAGFSGKPFCSRPDTSVCRTTTHARTMGSCARVRIPALSDACGVTEELDRISSPLHSVLGAGWGVAARQRATKPRSARQPSPVRSHGSPPHDNKITALRPGCSPTASILAHQLATPRLLYRTLPLFPPAQRREGVDAVSHTKSPGKSQICKALFPTDSSHGPDGCPPHMRAPPATHRPANELPRQTDTNCIFQGSPLRPIPRGSSGHSQVGAANITESLARPRCAGDGRGWLLYVLHHRRASPRGEAGQVDRPRRAPSRCSEADFGTTGQSDIEKLPTHKLYDPALRSSRRMASRRVGADRLADTNGWTVARRRGSGPSVHREPNMASYRLLGLSSGDRTSCTRAGSPTGTVARDSCRQAVDGRPRRATRRPRRLIPSSFQGRLASWHGN